MVCAAGPYVAVRRRSPMNGLGTSCNAEVSKPPVNARKKPGDSRGGLGERDKAPGAIVKATTVIYLRAAESAAVPRRADCYFLRVLVGLIVLKGSR